MLWALELPHHVQNGSEAYPALYQMCTMGSSSGVKVGQSVKLPFSSILLQGYECVSLYIHTPFKPSKWGEFYLVLKFLLQAFHLFDLNNDGFIDKEDLKKTYISLGKTDVCDEQIHRMLSEVQ
jgi:hypothetical protein